MLEIKNFSKSYGDKKAVDGLSLTIKDGEIYAFIGHNGAGKTTTLKAIAGILPFDEGEIIINGHDIKKEPLVAKKEMAYIPDNPDLYDFLKGIDYINFIADVYGVESDVRKKRIEKYAKLLEIYDDLSDPIGTYSHGMKQKVALIAALVHDPKVILMDEPFVGLDPKASHTLKELMHKMCDEGALIFYSTHVLEVAEKLCDRVAIIKKGKLLKEGKMEDVVGDDSLEEVFLELEGENNVVETH